MGLLTGTLSLLSEVASFISFGLDINDRTAADDPIVQVLQDYQMYLDNEKLNDNLAKIDGFGLDMEQWRDAALWAAGESGGNVLQMSEVMAEWSGTGAFEDVDALTTFSEDIFKYMHNEKMEPVEQAQMLSMLSGALKENDPKGEAWEKLLNTYPDLEELGELTSIQDIPALFAGMHNDINAEFSKNDSNLRNHQNLAENAKLEAAWEDRDRMQRIIDEGLADAILANDIAEKLQGETGLTDESAKLIEAHWYTLINQALRDLGYQEGQDDPAILANQIVDGIRQVTPEEAEKVYSDLVTYYEMLLPNFDLTEESQKMQSELELTIGWLREYLATPSLDADVQKFIESTTNWKEMIKSFFPDDYSEMNLSSGAEFDHLLFLGKELQEAYGNLTEEQQDQVRFFYDQAIDQLAETDARVYGIYEESGRIDEILGDARGAFLEFVADIRNTRVPRPTTSTSTPQPPPDASKREFNASDLFGSYGNSGLSFPSEALLAAPQAPQPEVHNHITVPITVNVNAETKMDRAELDAYVWALIHSMESAITTQLDLP